jgi:hypothetical protein
VAKAQPRPAQAGRPADRRGRLDAMPEVPGPGVALDVAVHGPTGPAAAQPAADAPPAATPEWVSPAADAENASPGGLEPAGAGVDHDARRFFRRRER